MKNWRGKLVHDGKEIAVSVRARAKPQLDKLSHQLGELKIEAVDLFDDAGFRRAMVFPPEHGQPRWRFT